MSLKILHEDKNAKILIVTALYTGHAVSGETKTTIRRNKTPYIWISYMSDGKHATNVQKAISAYRKKVGGIIPPYIFVLDRDIICGRHMLDKMINVLGKADKNIGFCYCPFEYSGHINIKFPPMEYDINTLVHGNYISSNSLYKTSMVERVGGFVVEEKYHRMSDWAFFIKSLAMPTRFSSGTSQSSRMISPVGEDRSPIFSNFLPAEYPGKLFSTTNVLSPPVPCPGSSVA